jgi:hypothetical protein
MGLLNNRAFCPRCGGKVHTQARGLGHLTWARSGLLVQTGSVCQHCGVALSGKVGLDNRAILAETAQAQQDHRAEGRTVRRDARQERKAGRADLDARVLDALASGPVTVYELATRFGVSRNQVRAVMVRQSGRVRSRGHRSRETLSLR